MSLLARHRYMISRLSEVFERPESEMETLMLSPQVLDSLRFFFSIDGPTKVLLIIQKDESGNESLKVLSKEFSNLKATAVYFMKSKRGRDNDDRYAIDASKANDGAMTFGIIRNPLESLEAVMRCVYRPMIQDLGGETWGQASEEQRQEFLVGIDSFCKGLQESIRSLSGGLELRKPDDRIEILGASAVGDIGLVTGCVNLLQDWCRNIEYYLEDSDRNRWETADSGPDTELEYWRSRMQRSPCFSLFQSFFVTILLLS